MRNMKVTVILIIIGALGTIQKNLEKRRGKLKIHGRTETVQTTALLWSARILRLVPVRKHVKSKIINFNAKHFIPKSLWTW